MKDKIIVLIIGILLGATIATGSFYAYTKANSSNECTCEKEQTKNDGQPPEMQDGQGGQPPEKPDGNGMQNNGETQNKTENN